MIICHRFTRFGLLIQMVATTTNTYAITVIRLELSNDIFY